MHDIIIIGAGGFGREVYQWSLAAFDGNEYRLKGFLSAQKDELDAYEINGKIIGHEDSYEIQDSDRFIIAIGNVAIKQKVVKKLKSKNAKFLTLIHPTAIVSANSIIGEGVVICPYVILTDSVIIGDFSMLNIYSSCGHDSKVGKFCILSPYATLNGGAILEDGVFMATQAIVAGSKLVGQNAVIGANSLVLHDVPANGKVIGTSRKPDA